MESSLSTKSLNAGLSANRALLIGKNEISFMVSVATWLRIGVGGNASFTARIEKAVQRRVVTVMTIVLVIIIGLSVEMKPCDIVIYSVRIWFRGYRGRCGVKAVYVII